MIRRWICEREMVSREPQHEEPIEPRAILLDRDLRRVSGDMVLRQGVPPSPSMSRIMICHADGDRRVRNVEGPEVPVTASRRR